ncbi:G-type lectin S-receptor-like serine/threonine-protein kinase At4g27290 [Humulus lupulus]|uniref:G-type lectin S-receptor-like serine/threonine-protein kinase At4g27290 n=1 Tax=Humulus lupulus TaxID=3486 RepID=UPI002B405FA6|nr:G-type lectin S-receptor-like serine/threonine-protein kinase At4g27290 [Humulus lupulus]
MRECFLFRSYHLLCCLFLLFRLCSAVNSLRPLEPISDGRTLVSQNGSFELGFFSPGSSKNRYLGIWYKNIPIQTVVWVANRCNPISDMSGVLTLNNSGNLLLLGQNKTIVWSTSTISSKLAQKPYLQLLESGNLVIGGEENRTPEAYLWQSFDYPSDTLLPGMKTGFNVRTGHKWVISAWKNADDPCPNDLTCGIEPHAYPELSIRKGDKEYYRHGPWNGLHFSGTLHLRPNPISEYEFVHNDEVFFRYHLKNMSVISRMVLNPTTSTRERLQWNDAEKTWSLLSTAPTDYCDSYALCGVNGKCAISSSPVCQCLKGFRPKFPERWNSLVWADGCERKTPLSCQDKEKDGFIKFSNIKVPDTKHTWVNWGMDLKECRAKCLSNCSCVAYSNTDIREDGSGCAIWFGDLIDIKEIPGGGQDVYIRMPASELRAKGDRRFKALIAASVIGAVCGILIAGYFIWRRFLTAKSKRIREGKGDKEEDMELPQFDLSTIIKATDNFSEYNKLGEGGFGSVYKGNLEDRHEIAVKRLSMSSGQGVKEFKNEVVLIAKLQHRNLVKLLGFCIQGEEKLLVYEYLSNNSLASFIFDQMQAKLLEWPKRFQIICGIARGLLYLHQDSRLRIIHRDLKASNILLDNEMNPKISDFGMARTFGGEQIEGNTNKVVGTYGYMAPEYAFNGLFSTKSDIFSFGIIVLETISGQRSRMFRPQKDNLTLTGHAWKLMKEGREIELLDECLRDSQNSSEVLRCIHVGLLCVQQNPMDRPSMPSVVMMLGSESVLPQPKKPGYFMETDLPIDGYSKSFLTNYVTMSILEAR